MTEDTHREVSWNLASMLIQEISMLLMRASQYYIAGKYDLALQSLKAVKNRIIQSMNKEERDNFLELEKQAEQKTRQTSTVGMSAMDKRYAVMKAIRSRLMTNIIDDYNEKLMDVLQKYGYLIEAKKDSSKMKF